MYEVLPADRQWPQQAEDLAQQLAARLDSETHDDRRSSEAALGLLLRGPVDLWTDLDVAEVLLDCPEGLSWSGLSVYLDENCEVIKHWDPADRMAHVRALAAASIGFDVDLSLCYLVDELDAAGANDLIDALAHACGVTR